VTAHAVGDHEQTQLLIDEEVVLVMVSLATNIGRGREGNLHLFLGNIQLPQGQRAGSFLSALTFSSSTGKSLLAFALVVVLGAPLLAMLGIY
jgi:hypothetical protein